MSGLGHGLPNRPRPLGVSSTFDCCRARLLVSTSASCRAKIFTRIEFDFAAIEHRLRELAFLNSGVTIVLTDKRGSEKKEVVLHN